MAEIIDQYGDVIVYSEEGHPTPFYEYNGQIAANPYGVLQVSVSYTHLTLATKRIV